MTHKQRRNAKEELPWKLGRRSEEVGSHQFYSRETWPLILMQLQIANICSVHLGVRYFISETSEWNTIIINTLKKQSKGFNFRSEVKTQEKITNRTTMGLTVDVDSQAPRFWHIYWVGEKSSYNVRSDSRRAIKEERKVISNNLVNKNTCGLP